MKKTLFISSLIAAFILTSGDADARRRHSRHKPHHNRIARHYEPAKPLPPAAPADKKSVFDTQDWQPEVPLPGLMTVWNAFSESKYPWSPSETHRSVRMEAYQELKQLQKPITNGLRWHEHALLGALIGGVVGLGIVAVWPLRA